MVTGGPRSLGGWGPNHETTQSGGHLPSKFTAVPSSARMTSSEQNRKGSQAWLSGHGMQHKTCNLTWFTTLHILLILLIILLLHSPVRNCAADRFPTGMVIIMTTRNVFHHNIFTEGIKYTLSLMFPHFHSRESGRHHYPRCMTQTHWNPVNKLK